MIMNFKCYSDVLNVSLHRVCTFTFEYDYIKYAQTEQNFWNKTEFFGSVIYGDNSKEIRCNQSSTRYNILQMFFDSIKR